MGGIPTARGPVATRACLSLNGAMSTPVDDPRVQALVEWAHKSDARLTRRASNALAALQGSTPRPATAPALAQVAGAAYQRVPNRGPRDLQTGHAVVELLGELGEAGGRELLRLRERTTYHHPLARISRVMAELQQRLGVPLGEFEDTFTGPVVDSELSTDVLIGPFRARLQVTDDLRRVQTSWISEAGRPLAKRPTAARGHPYELSRLDSERRHLRAHVRDLRQRLEDALTSGRSWSAEQWSDRMFSDPLRAAMARRMIWRVEGSAPVLALPEVDGLADVHGRRVPIGARDNVSIWHPADAPGSRGAWQERLRASDVDQPVDQAWREVVLADLDSPALDFAYGKRAKQTAMRGFLLNRGWKVPFLGPYFEVPEATRELTPHGPIAVLDRGWFEEDPENVAIWELDFRSVQDVPLDARDLPPALVSEAARDVLGAIRAGQP